MTHPDRPKGLAYDLPKCDLVVGTKLHPALVMSTPTNGKYYRRAILRSEVARTRKIINKLRRQKFINDGLYRLPEYNKNQIREMMAVVDFAYEAEVCGIHASGHHFSGTAHQSFIGGSAGASGIRYQAQLLFRAVSETGDHIAYIPTIFFAANDVASGTAFI